MAKILVLNGPNLNLLGQREPEQYGYDTLDSINNRLATATKHQLSTFQSNTEHGLVERIQQTLNDKTDFIIFNPAAFTHTSIALRDALLAVNIPFIEIHISNIYAREKFRQCSYFSDIATGTITGLGSQVYDLALQAAEQRFKG